MSKRVELELGDLLSNPYRKQIQNGRLDPKRIKELKESVNETSLWERWVVRKTPQGYELAMGHHLLAAAIELFGKHHKVSVQVEQYTDPQMMIALADDNAGEGASFAEQQDTVVMAQKYLREHPEACKTHPVRRAQGGGSPHEHGSEHCVSAFLGEENWSRDKVHGLIKMESLHEDLKQIVAPGGDRVARKGPAPGTIGTESAEILGTLPKSVQSAAAKAIENTPIGLPKIAIKAAVKAVSDKPEAVQKQEIKKAIADVASEQAEAVADRAAVKKMTKPSAAKKTVAEKDEISDKEAAEIDDFVKKCKQAQSAISLVRGVPGDIVSAAHDIVKTGFVELSKVRHPDHGGSESEQQALNAARKWLETLIQTSKEK